MRNLFILLFLYLIPLHSQSSEIKLEKIFDGLDKPWSLSFINSKSIIITEKGGKLLYLNLNDRKLTEIKHNLSLISLGQGGLLDVLYKDKQVYISYSENRGNWETSTSVAKGSFDQNKIKFKNIFRAEPPIESGYHFGSRLVINDNHLYITAGERGQGNDSSRYLKTPRSIIRINIDGSIPKDNPKFQGKKDWLPEIFQIGVRNPQGIALRRLIIKYIYQITELKEVIGLVPLTVEKTMGGKF